MGGVGVPPRGAQAAAETLQLGGHLVTSCMQVPNSPGTVDQVQPFLHWVHLP